MNFYLARGEGPLREQEDEFRLNSYVRYHWSEVAILGLMRAKMRPVAVEKEGTYKIAIRKVMYLSVTLVGWSCWDSLWKSINSVFGKSEFIDASRLECRETSSFI